MGCVRSAKPTTHTPNPYCVKALLMLLAVLLLVGGVLAYVFAGLPNVDSLPQHLRQPSLRITDRNGHLLYQVLLPDSGRHAVVSLDRMDIIIC